MTMSMQKIFRKGAIGAMMDEYERAVLELQKLFESISTGVYEKVLDPQTQDENCRSIQTIISHVVSSGYSYADYFRSQFGMSSARPQKRLLAHEEAPNKITAMLNYTIDTLENRWEMSEDQITSVAIQSNWGVRYDMEQLFEHAIVHVLRHRRQIEKFLSQNR